MNNSKKRILSIFINGFLTGMFLQLAVGPVFFFILNIALQKTIIDGLLAVIAVTIADYIYIILAILGVGRLLEKKRVKNILGIAGAVVLIIFGLIMILTLASSEVNKMELTALPSNYLASFLTAFLLTISSPLTIVFWTGLFAAKAVEMGYSKKQLRIFGISAGLATIVFLGICVIVFSMLKASIPVFVINLLNILVGILLALYGLVRLVNIFRNLTQLQSGEE